MPAEVARAAGAHAALRRAARLAREANAAAAAAVGSFEADVVATFDVTAGSSALDVSQAIAEAAAEIDVTVVVTRNATTAPGRGEGASQDGIQGR